MDLEVFRYIIGVKINGKDHPKAATNILESAEAVYIDLVLRHNTEEDNHIFVYLFDFEKNTNIGEYDNYLDRS